MAALPLCGLSSRPETSLASHCAVCLSRSQMDNGYQRIHPIHGLLESQRLTKGETGFAGRTGSETLESEAGWPFFFLTCGLPFSTGTTYCPHSPWVRVNRMKHVISSFFLEQGMNSSPSTVKFRKSSLRYEPCKLKLRIRKEENHTRINVCVTPSYIFLFIWGSIVSIIFVLKIYFQTVYTASPSIWHPALFEGRTKNIPIKGTNTLHH